MIPEYQQTSIGLFGDGSESWELDNFAVEKIGKDEARTWNELYHYSGGMGNAPIPYGCYQRHTGERVGVIAFHTPGSENTRASVFEDIDGQAHEHRDVCDCDHIQAEVADDDGKHGYREHVTELHRMAIHPDAPPNTATWFISRALDRLKEYKPKYWAVLSFADRTEGHDGTVYQAANADYAGTTSPATFYRDNDGQLRHPRQCGENITVEEANRRGWEKEKRDAKHRYVFWTPDPYQTKDQLRQLSELDLQSYPD